MPRKIKTAFSSSDADRAIVGIHDIGFMPRIRDGVKGFEIVVGGGTSIMPRIAPTLYEFVAADDGEYLRVTEAALRIFDRQEWLRVNRARARIKVLVDKIGMDDFRKMVDRELEGDWVGERDFSIERLLPGLDEEATAPPPPAPPVRRTATGPSSRRSSPTTSSGSARRASRPSHVKVIRGDLTPEQFRGLGAIMREFCGGNARTTVDQNLVLRWVRDESRLRRLHARSATSASPIPAPTRSRTSSRARGPTHARWASPPPWASTGRSRSDSRRWRSPIR